MSAIGDMWKGGKAEQPKTIEEAFNLLKEKKKKKIKYRSELHHFMYWFSESKFFGGFVMFTILVNTITIAVETDRELLRENQKVFSVLDFSFLAIYTLEAIVKIYVQPVKYWKNGYNRFDILILVISYVQFLQEVITVFAVFKQVTFLRVLRALRALRALRGVSFIRGLQVILVALVRTMASIVNILSILFLLMYVFAIMGYYLFGGSLKEQWGSLGNAFFTLFIFVTADGWTDTQAQLDTISISTRLYTVLFIWIANFIFTNLFIGVVIRNLEQATDEDRHAQLTRRKTHIEKKKLMILQMQNADVSRLLQLQNEDPDLNLQQILAQLAGKLRHDDLVPMSTLMSNTTWLETFMVALHHQENTMYKQQQINFEIANTLADLIEQKLQREVKDY